MARRAIEPPSSALPVRLPSAHYAQSEMEEESYRHVSRDLRGQMQMMSPARSILNWAPRRVSRQSRSEEPGNCSAYQSQGHRLSSGTTVYSARRGRRDGEPYYA